MPNATGKVYAFNLWLFDLVLTAASFLLAYRLRSTFAVEGHPVFPLDTYFWMLWSILPVWAVILPSCRVYAVRALPPVAQVVQLSKALGFAWIVVGVLLFLSSGASNRLLVVLTFVINYILLASYRIVIFRGNTGETLRDDRPSPRRPQRPPNEQFPHIPG